MDKILQAPYDVMYRAKKVCPQTVLRVCDSWLQAVDRTRIYTQAYYPQVSDRGYATS